MKVKKAKKEIPHGYILLASILREGKENSLTSQEIIRALGWSTSEKRNVFHIVEALIKKYGYVIGASRKGEYRGYYLISNRDEYVETMQTYNAQIQSMLERHRKLEENYLQQFELVARGENYS